MTIYKIYDNRNHFDHFYSKGKSNYYLHLEEAIAEFKKTRPEVAIVKEGWDKTNTKYRLYTELSLGTLYCYESILKIEVNE